MSITPNNFILEKADVLLTDLSGTGGLVQPGQAATFLRRLIDKAVLLKYVNIIRGDRPTYVQDLISYDSVVMQLGAEATALGAGTKATLGKVTFTTSLIKGQVNVNDMVLEDNIEKHDFLDVIMEEMAKGMARDVDDLLINGDSTLGGSVYLSTFDGFLKQATTNVVAAGTVPLTKSVILSGIKLIPSRYKVLEDLRIFTSMNAELDYADTFTSRQTPLGDSTLQNKAQSGYRNIPVIPVNKFPENLGSGTNETNALLLDPKNMGVYFQRMLRIETDKNITTGVMNIVASSRLAAKYLVEPAVAKITGIKAA